MNIEVVEGASLADAWYQTLYRAVEKGRIFKVDRGSYAGQSRLEFDFVVVRVSQPWVTPLLPTTPEGSPPADEEYLKEYLLHLMTGAVGPNESYTYGQRLTDAPVPGALWGKIGHQRDLYIEEASAPDRVPGLSLGIPPILDQVELLIHTYKTHGHRNNQMVLQVGQPTDMLIKDPPCLRHIDTRIQDGRLHFFPYFRSWDLYNGFPVNLAAIETLKQHVAGAIGVENGEIIASSKGLHLYDHVWPLVETLRGKTIAALRGEMGR